MLKVLSLFSGIGAFEVALDELGIEWELDHYCEIDKYACQSYNCIHGTTDEDNLKDVTNIDYSKIGDIDLVTYGFPCQDISLAGNQKGFFDEDGNLTRSGLFFNAADVIRHTNPKFAIFENVKNLTGKKFKKEFETVLSTLDELGYNTYWKILNAKDYGIPQNRERVFGISIRKDIDKGYTFPQGFELTLRLKDMLEDEVDEKYYLSNKMIEYITSNNDKWTGNNNKSLVNKSIATTLNTGEGSRRCDASNYIIPSIEQEDVDLKAIRKYGISTTLTSSMGCGGGYVPMINEPSIKELGYIKKSENGTWHQSNTVYDADGIARTLTAVDYKAPLKIVEPKRIGGPFDDEKGKHQAGSIWDTEHLSPTLDTMQGGYRQPCIIVPEATKKGYAEAEPGDSINLEQPNSKTRRGRVGKGVAQTLTTSCNQAVVEPLICASRGRNPNNPSSRKAGEPTEQRIEVNTKGLCNTLTTVQKDNLVIEPKLVGGIGEKNFGKQFRQGNRVYDSNEIAVCLTAQPVGNTGGNSYLYQLPDFRIRKLTPRECWRLMGFRDYYFNKVKGVSNTQLYKQAGNSIVVDVLKYIFKELHNQYPEYFSKDEWGSDL